jgi:predicted transcriptional regulator
MKNVNTELQWFGQSLGLFGERDKDKSCFRLFIELLKALRKGEALTSDQLAERLNLSRGTVIHHMHKLIDAGLVVTRNGRYILRVENLGTLIAEMKKDMNRVFEDLTAMADDLDHALGLEARH